jgi:glutaredoxin
MLNRFVVTLAGVSLSLLSAVALAQYKYVGPDGKVVYSDQPPPANVKGVQKTSIGGNTAASSGAALPFALQGPSRNFPVTLFSAAGCSGCDSARTFLSARGIPFTEKIVKTAEDAIVLKVETGESGVPVVLIGKTKQLGFDIAALTSALDAAGYPSTSQLPPGFKQVTAKSAAPEKSATADAKASPDAAATTTANSSPPAPPPAAPAGERPTWFKGF